MSNGFASEDEILNATTTNSKAQQIWVEKTLSTTVAGGWQTAWNGVGFPEAGTTPTVGSAGAVKCDKSTTGAFPFTNAAGGAKLNLLSGCFRYTGTAGNTLVLLDRLAHANIAYDAAGTTTFSPVIDGTDRLAAGEGAMIMTEVTTGVTTSNTRTFTYTNQAGTGGRVTPNAIMGASLTVGRIPASSSAGVAQLFVPLQAGDIGVRTITDTTLVSGTGTGAINICLVKPLAYIPIPANGIDVDFIWSLPTMPRIKDNMCLMFAILPGGATAGTITSQLTLGEN